MEKSDEALMRQLQTGDSSAFDTLVKRWEKPLLNYCYRMVNDITLAEDLRQEVFLRIYRSVQRYCPTAKFSTWMYRIAINPCLDTLDKKGYQAEIPMGDYLTSGFEGLHSSLIDPSDTPDAVAIKKEDESQVQAALAGLPEELWIVVMLRHYHDLKFREIAAIVGCPASTAKSRLAVGMERLRQILSGQEETVNVQ